MTEHNLFYYPYASFTNAQLPLLKVAALYFDKFVLLAPWRELGQRRRQGLGRLVGIDAVRTQR